MEFRETERPKPIGSGGPFTPAPLCIPVAANLINNGSAPDSTFLLFLQKKKKWKISPTAHPVQSHIRKNEHQHSWNLGAESLYRSHSLDLNWNVRKQREVAQCEIKQRSSPVYGGKIEPQRNFHTRLDRTHCRMVGLEGCQFWIATQEFLITSKTVLLCGGLGRVLVCKLSGVAKKRLKGKHCWIQTRRDWVTDTEIGSRDLSERKLYIFFWGTFI